MKTKMEKFAILSLSWMLISTYSVSTALPAMKEYLYRIQRKSGGVSGVGSGAWDYLHDSFSYGDCKILKRTADGGRRASPLVCKRDCSGIYGYLSGDSWIPSSAWYRNWSGQCKGDQHDQRTLQWKGTGDAAWISKLFEMLGNAVLTLIAGQLLAFGWQKAFSVYALGFLVLTLYLLFVPEKEGNVSDTAAAGVLNGKFERKNCRNCNFLYNLWFLTGGSKRRLLVKNSGTGRRTRLWNSINSQYCAEYFDDRGDSGGISLWKSTENLSEKNYFSSVWQDICAGMVLMAAAGSFLLFMAGVVITGFAHTTGITCVFNGAAADEPGELLSVVNSIVLVGCNLGSACAPFLIGGIELVWPVSFAAFPVIGIVLLLIGWMKGRD